MKARPQNIPYNRLLVIMPGLLGEAVMATATLNALRGAQLDANITVLVKRRLRPVLYGLSYVDRIWSIRKRSEHKGEGRSSKSRASVIRLGKRLSRANFDTAVILPLSFRAAALPAVAGIPRRLGYEHDRRGVLLTDRLIPPRNRGEKPRSASIDSYLALARYMGAKHPSGRMQLVLKPEATHQLETHLKKAGISQPTQELLLVNPGAPSSARRWSPRRMAHLCEMLSDRYSLTPVVTGTPSERRVVRELLDRATVPIVDLPELGRDLHLLKAMVARSRMMVTNDTGPRFLAAAMGIPVLTLFGPTSPQGSGLSLSHEEQVVSDGISVADMHDRGFKGRASLDLLHADEVFEHASQLYETTRRLHVTGTHD
ncbi:MAG: glycosyltransferase family 9 protein [Planctomycetota bacterium]